MIIRPEKKDEFSLIYDLVHTAFETAKVKDGKEQDYVNHLRSGGGYIPELALVAEEAGHLIGHIMLSKIPVIDGDQKHDILLLAPVCIVLDRRNKGFGAQLIEECFRRARGMNFGAVLVVGDPSYYVRFGFKTSTDFGIKNTNGFPDQYIMALELRPGGLNNIRGEVTF